MYKSDSYCLARCFGDDVGELSDDDRETRDNLEPLAPLVLPKYITDPVCVCGRPIPMLLKSTRLPCADVGAEGESK